MLTALLGSHFLLLVVYFEETYLRKNDSNIVLSLYPCF